MPALRVAFFTLFLDLLGFGLIIPIAPFYAESFGASPSTVTLIGAAYSLMQFLFAPMWGSLSDRLGRRPIILTSIAIAAVGFLVYGFATSLWMLFAARMISGFGNANIGTVHAIAADVTSGKDRVKAMGMMGAAFGLGFIVGPVFGGIIGATWGPNAPALAAAVLCAVNFVFAAVALPETRTPGAHARSERGFAGLRALTNAKGRVNVPALLLLSLAFTIGFAMMESSLGLFVERTFIAHDLFGTEEGHKAATRATTWLLLAAGVVSVIVQGGLIRKLKDVTGEKSLMLAGCAMLTVSLAALPLVSTTLGYAAAFVPLAILSFGSGLYSPSASSLLSRSSGADEQGSMLSLGQSMSALGRIIGPASAGVIFERGISMPFFVGAGLMALCTVIALTLKQPRDDEEPTATAASTATTG